MNGTVCPGNFNWYTANTFCQYLGNKQGEWGSKPNNYWNLISEPFLLQQTIKSVILNELICKDINNKNTKSECFVNVSTDSCRNNQSVWLYCTNETDMWSPVVNEKSIPADLDTSYLHLRTISTVGTSSREYIRIYFYSEEGEYGGGIVTWFGTPVEYYLPYCQSGFTPFQSLPAETDKHWVVERRSYRIIVYCNGKQVLNITASSETCSDESWNTYWGNEVSIIKLYAGSTTSYYNIERAWEFERASLINMVTGTSRLNDSGGLLIATVYNKQTGMVQNGTVCKDAFNWYSAQLFCWTIGHHFSDWGSNPRNMKYVPE
ncbi:uncharacterized protein LOC134822166 [Bolinopsis microptera]|uniref:uncharacterized protein LOC134822166 n=1 Tax=Bolinopsis microptera TaxID=2820187 RepID=UPI00307AA341